ncbi:MAG TPA: hypothetical protein VK880_07860, partial [Anaerolineales bacterium]|nr:hypothetical protein [Anaerolineales bacterium]
LGRAELRVGNDVSAKKHIIDALKLAVKSRDLGVILVALAAYAEMLAQQGKYESAVLLASLVYHHVLTWHETRKQAADLLKLLKRSIPGKRFTSAEKRGRAADIWKLAEDLIRQR